MLRGLIPRENPESDKINRAQTFENRCTYFSVMGFDCVKRLVCFLQHLLFTINKSDRKTL